MRKKVPIRLKTQLITECDYLSLYHLEPIFGPKHPPIKNGVDNNIVTSKYTSRFSIGTPYKYKIDCYAVLILIQHSSVKENPHKQAIHNRLCV